VKNLDEGVGIICEINSRGSTVTLTANLKLREENNGLLVNLTTINGANTKFTAFQRVGSITTEGLLKVGTEDFPAFILRNLTEQYNEQNKVAFNALTFFQTHDVLTSTNEIKDSDFTVLDREGDDLTMLQVMYAPDETMKVTPDGPKAKIRIKMNLEVTQMRVAERSAKRYNVTLHLKDVQTNPSELEDKFRIYDTYSEQGGFKRAIFSTGQNDTGVPVQESYNSSIGSFLQRAILSVLNAKDTTSDFAPYSVRGDIRYRQGMPEPYNSPKMQEEFRIKEVWKALARDPPVKPHCMARALQLLNLAAIKGDTNGAYSRVCFTDKDKFPLMEDGSLPTPGRPVTDSIGIRALAMLFLNAVDKSADALKGSEQYKEFRTKFKRAFEKYEDNYEVASTTSPPTLKEIGDKAMPFCKDNQNERIALDPGMAYELRAKVNVLQNRQATHVANAMQILFKLFDEKEIRAGRFELSDYVWQEGTDALAQLTVETRDLLISYYTDCESTYKDGLYLLYNKARSAPKEGPPALTFMK
jgi:hypothetical protein